MLEKFKDILYSTSSDIVHFCEKNLREYGIEYFDYIRFYDDGTALGLACEPKLIELIAQNQLYMTLRDIFSFCQSGSCLSIISEKFPILSQTMRIRQYNLNIEWAASLNVYHRCYYMCRRDDYYLTCGFGIRHDSPQILAFFLNAKELLGQFIFTFEQQAHDIIKKAEQNRTQLVAYQDMDLDIFNNQLKSSNKPQFPEKISLRVGKNLVELTHRELETITLKLSGNTSKEIGSLMGISHRTVEKHIQNIREKVGPLSNKALKLHLWPFLKII